jgi:hypothetical protein
MASATIMLEVDSDVAEAYASATTESQQKL